MPLAKRSTLVIWSFWNCLVLNTAWADQIVLKDGDRITGEIVMKDGQTVWFKSKNFGVVTLKWDDIANVTTDKPLNVVLPNDQTVKANIQTQNDRIAIVVSGTPRTFAPTDIVALRDDAEQRRYERLIHPGPLDLWTITGSLNIAGAQGNAETFTITTPIAFVRESNTSRTTAYFNSIRSRATVNGVSGQTARAVRGGWAFNRNLAKKMFATAFNDYEHDLFQSLDLRIVLGGGAGYRLWTGERGRLGLLGGASWNRQTFSPPIGPSFTQNSGELYWGNDFNYKLNDRASIIQSFRMFHNLTFIGEQRINFDAGAVTQLTKWLTWNISVSERYLSFPAPGRQTGDFLYTTGLGFTFAR